MPRLGPRGDGQRAPAAEQHVGREDARHRPELDRRARDQHGPPRHACAAQSPPRPAQSYQGENRATERRQTRGPFVEPARAKTQRGGPINQRRLVVVSVAGLAGFPPVAAGTGHRHGDVGVTAFVRFVEPAHAQSETQEQPEKRRQQPPIARARKSRGRRGVQSDQRPSCQLPASWANVPGETCAK